MVNTKITIRQAINQVSDKEWTNHKNGKGSIKNAQVFEKYYGHENLLNHLATGLESTNLSVPWVGRD